MKIHILFAFTDGPWGGGNQFLKALKKQFVQMRVYSNTIDQADVILFNSHHCLEQVKQAKEKYSHKIFLHRLDGPIQLVRGDDFDSDPIIFQANHDIADGTIFQSHWIQKETEKLGFVYQKPATIILNAPDNEIFYQKKKITLGKNEKMRIIATSWSGNMRKGFDVYQWLDCHLDFSQFEMTFVGNAPIKFKQITQKEAMPSAQLAQELRQHHLYLTASKFEPCSNALIEAMHCGLSALAYNNGGNPEIVGLGGELFKSKWSLMFQLKRLKNNYQHYQQKINLPSIEEVAQAYLEFGQKIKK